MTVVRLVYIYCDSGESCPLSVDREPHTVSPVPDATATEERNRAALRGWRHVKGKDYCPECAKLRLRQKQEPS